MQRGVGGGDAGEGVEEEVAAFFGVEAAEEQQQALARKLGVGGVEGAALGVGVAGRGGGTVVDDGLAALVAGEGPAGQEALFLTGEADGLGVAEDGVFAPGPVEGLFGVLERVGGFEPGVQHAVGVEGIRDAEGAQRPAGGEAVVLPDAVDDDVVEPARVPLQPGDEARGVAVAGDAGAEGMDLEGHAGQPRGVGGVERDDLGGVAELCQGTVQLQDALDGAAALAVGGGDDMEDADGLHLGVHKGRCGAADGGVGSAEY